MRPTRRSETIFETNARSRDCSQAATEVGSKRHMERPPGTFRDDDAPVAPPEFIAFDSIVCAGLSSHLTGPPAADPPRAARPSRRATAAC